MGGTTEEEKVQKEGETKGVEAISDIEDGEDGNVCQYSLAQLMADCGAVANL